jgi:P22 coat protein - gene protein 5
MANTLPNSAIVAREALPILKNMLSFAHNVNRDYQDEFGSNMTRGYAPGQTINIKKPPRFSYRAGRVATPQDTVQTTVPLTLSQGGCDLYNTRLDRTLLLKSIEPQLMAGVATIANEIDRQGLELAKFATFNTLNPTGALPTTQALALQGVTDANVRLDEMAAPRDKRRAFIMNPKANGAMIQGFAGLFNNSGKISDQFNSGMMVDSLGIAYGMDQNVSVHTNGAATATNVNGANQVGSAITVVAVAGGTLTRGTAITLPGVFAVNPQSRVTTGSLMNFVVTADALAGATTINISPAIVTSGNFQNVTASPTTATPYVILGAVSTAYGSNIAYHRDAFTLAMVPMFEPGAGQGATSSTYSEDGFTLKVTEYWDGQNDQGNMRLDALFGWASTYPELSVKYYTL